MKSNYLPSFVQFVKSNFPSLCMMLVSNICHFTNILQYNVLILIYSRLVQSCSNYFLINALANYTSTRSICILIRYFQKFLAASVAKWVTREFAPSAEGREFEPPVGSSQRLKNWHLLLPWLAFTIKGLEQGWLAQCQFNVTGRVSCLSATWYFGVLVS